MGHEEGRDSLRGRRMGHEEGRDRSVRRALVHLDNEDVDVRIHGLAHRLPRHRRHPPLAFLMLNVSSSLIESGPTAGENRKEAAVIGGRDKGDKTERGGRRKRRGPERGVQRLRRRLRTPSCWSSPALANCRRSRGVGFSLNTAGSWVEGGAKTWGK